MRGKYYASYRNILIYEEKEIEIYLINNKIPRTRLVSFFRAYNECSNSCKTLESSHDLTQLLLQIDIMLDEK